MDIEEIFNCKEITASSLNLYKTKLKILNDNKPIKNINYLYDIDKIQEKIKSLKPNTRRTYIIAITSILACLTKDDKKPPKKLKKLYQDYSKLLDNYNNELKDQTNENTDVISDDKVKEVYENLKANRDKDKQSYQNYLVLSLYHLLPPRRNKDYQLMKFIKNYNDELNKDFNYYDGKRFYFTNYKTRGKYSKQEMEVPPELKEIIDFHLKANDLKDGDFILRDFKKNSGLTGNNAMTGILNKIFKDKIGASALRRAYLTNKYSNVRDELNQDVKAMGTSTEVAQNNYIKNNRKSSKPTPKNS